MRRLIVGCGYLGRRVADRWARQQDEVFVLTRSDRRARQLASGGLQPLIGDVTDPASLPDLPKADTLLWAVGHDRRSDKTLEEVYVVGFNNLLAAVAVGTQRVIYVSSTGVYGQQDGAWVDETSLCQPNRVGGKACLAAEHSLLASRWSDRALILRLAGIYGPQRLPRLRQLLDGQPLSGDPDGVINLIHVEDAATAVFRAADLPLPLPRTYLIADGQPVSRRTFYEELARQTHAPSPQFKAPTAGARGTDRSGSHKRVANARMINELGIQLRYPSFREGLLAVARETMTNDQ